MNNTNGTKERKTLIPKNTIKAPEPMKSKACKSCDLKRIYKLFEEKKRREAEAAKAAAEAAELERKREEEKARREAEESAKRSEQKKIIKVSRRPFDTEKTGAFLLA